MIYTDIISHRELGTIYIYWGDDGRIKEVGLSSSHLDTVAIQGNFKEAMPEVYRYLEQFPTAPHFAVELLDLDDFSPFYRRVYQTLFYIPIGRAVTYAELAELAGSPRAARAVGTAMRKNKFLLLIPCHRVLAANSIGGFSIGLDIKVKLLEMEGVLTVTPHRQLAGDSPSRGECLEHPPLEGGSKL
ncbi:MAG: MGMT family protein [Deferribacteraceae bacterium]|jgi:O-6-methylguanine DNA methyltransferase|nr:MGMT family protein [Deferribacteraceae bacterium]